jgi:hypothetical protein
MADRGVTFTGGGDDLIGAQSSTNENMGGIPGGSGKGFSSSVEDGFGNSGPTTAWPSGDSKGMSGSGPLVSPTDTI